MTQLARPAILLFRPPIRLISACRVLGVARHVKDLPRDHITSALDLPAVLILAKRAYRSQMRHHHTDIGGCPNRHRELSVAYQRIKDLCGTKLALPRFKPYGTSARAIAQQEYWARLTETQRQSRSKSRQR